MLRTGLSIDKSVDEEGYHKMSVSVMFLCFVFNFSSYRAIRVKNGINYINPVNLSFLRDRSVETCTVFAADVRSETPQFTTFRLPFYDERVDYVNVTLIGQNLSCGVNLYVIPLTAAQTKQWTGLWTTCPLLAQSQNKYLENCTFNCHCLGACAEIQVSKRPITVEENSWSLCHLDIRYHSEAPILVNGCDDVRVTQSGIYLLNMTPIGTVTVPVYCEMELNGGGWMIIMRRQDGSENFDREWEDYKSGFGLLTGEFWAGNELIHKLTTGRRKYSLRVDLESYSGKWYFAVYSVFSLGPESDNYRFHINGYWSNSTAGDSLSYHNNMQFTTKSRDNDMSNDNCAVNYGAPWWFKACHFVFLTGQYGEDPPENHGITWHSISDQKNFARFVTMAIRANS